MDLAGSLVPGNRSASGMPVRTGAAGQSDDRSTIILSHGLSTVRKADLIVVLDGSRMFKVGGHEALVAKGSYYAELYEIQAEAYRQVTRRRTHRTLSRRSATRSPTGRGCNRVIYFVATANS